MKFKFEKKKLKNILISLGICVALIIIDQITKIIAVKNLSVHNHVPFIKGIIEFNLSYNTGFAFGLGDGYQWLWAIVSIIGCVIIVYFMQNVDFKKNIVYTLSLILIFSGTFGNMIDRIFSSKGVIDFIDPVFMDFAIFNVADSYITIGAILLAVYILFIYKDPEETKIEPTNEIDETSTTNNDEGGAGNE